MSRRIWLGLALLTLFAILAVLAAGGAMVLAHEPAPLPPQPARPARAVRPVACASERKAGNPSRTPLPGQAACFLPVPGGTFPMGAQSSDPAGAGYDPDASSDEGPVHVVTVRPFWMLHKEVDVPQFEACVQSGGCKAEDVAPGGGYFNDGLSERRLHPINGVTWAGARDFCAWLGARLPTEAEWEFAARVGGTRRYPWGDARPSCELAIMDEGGRPGCGVDSTRETWHRTQSDATAFELRHLAGNVWEWVADWYGPYDGASQDNPRGPASGTRRVHRGGAWTSSDPAELRGAYRASLDPDRRVEDVGIRCAADGVDDGSGDSPWAGEWTLRYSLSLAGCGGGRETESNVDVRGDGTFENQGARGWIADGGEVAFVVLQQDGKSAGLAGGRCESRTNCAGTIEVHPSQGKWTLAPR